MKENSEIKVIVFDLGGTVFTKGKTIFISKLAKEIGKQKSEVTKIVDGKVAQEYRKNKIGENEYWRYVIKNLNINYKPSELKEFWFSQYQPLQGMERLIHQLKNNFKLGYLSNNVPERVKYLNNAYNFLSWFDNGIFSYEVKMLKNDRVIYHKLLDKFKYNPSQILIIDDKKDNLVYPHKLGFQTIKFNGASKLKKEIKKRTLSA